jgi:hypothetical protein
VCSVPKMYIHFINLYLKKLSEQIRVLTHSCVGKIITVVYSFYIIMIIIFTTTIPLRECHTLFIFNAKFRNSSHSRRIYVQQYCEPLCESQLRNSYSFAAFISRTAVLLTFKTTSMLFFLHLHFVMWGLKWSR